jgi:hypothetical protein
MTKKPTLKRLTTKRLGEYISAVYTKEFSGVQVPLLDVSMIYRAGERAYGTAFDKAAAHVASAALTPDQAAAAIRDAVASAMADVVARVRQN